MRKLSYFVAASVDGFIGEPGGDAEFFAEYVDEEYLRFLREEFPETLSTPGRKALGLDGLENRRFDTVIQGRASYDIALRMGVTSPYAHMRQYVASRTLGDSPDPGVEIIATGLLEKVRALKAEDGDLGIYLCGGAHLAGQLLDEVDELVVKTYPVVLGSGMPMFGAEFGRVPFSLDTDAVRVFGNGVVVRTYTRIR
ncbi:dihydrofolate reductase family protein [Streptomyces sp. ODS28]|uniref:dihydrofolate reductase family protein n=1 Tax=Streptomyces sp. ODS28 TaxID=3136688 RepID=UPI0031EA11F3